MMWMWGVASAAILELSPGDDLVGLSESLQPGDELILADGLYQIRGQIVWSVLSTESAPLTMRPAEGAEPVIELIPDEEGNYDNDILQIEDSSWVVVEGITFQGSTDWTDDSQNHRGIQVVNSSNVTISDVTVMQTGDTSIYLSGTNSGIVVENSHIHSTLNGYGFYVGCYDASCWTSSSRISNNWIHSIGGDDNWSIYLAHGSQGIEVTDNVIYGSAGYGVYLGSTEYGDRNGFEGNAIWGVSGIGLYIQGAARVRNNILFNNAICNPTGYGLVFEDPEVDTATPDSDNLITGNVACGLVEGLDEFDDAFTSGAGFADFSDVEGWDFYPASSDSTLIGTANPSGETYVPEQDFNGLTRDGDSPEVGAYEWTGSGNPGWAIQEGYKEFAQEGETIEETVGGGCCQEDGSSSAAFFLTPLVVFGVRRRRRAQASSSS